MDNVVEKAGKNAGKVLEKLWRRRTQDALGYSISFPLLHRGFPLFPLSLSPGLKNFFQRPESFPLHVDKIKLFAPKDPQTKEKQTFWKRWINRPPPVDKTLFSK